MEIALFLFQAFLISLSGVLAPGAVTAATIAAGARSRHAGSLIAVGHGIVEIPLMLAILAGMGVMFENEWIKIVIGVAGGGFLLWMGRGMFKSLKNASQDPAETIASGNPVRIGFILSISNPYFLLWWATIGLALAKDAQKLGAMAFVLFALIHWLCDLVWLEALSWTSFKGGALLGPKKLKAILAVCAGALVFFGVIFIYKAIRQIIGMM